MNQILATSQEPKSKKTKNRGISGSGSDIKKVTKVFAVILLLFGIFVIGTGVYAIYKNNNSRSDIIKKPTISVEDDENSKATVILKATGEAGIQTVEYQWNDNKQTTISGNGGKYIEQKIQIPNGSNVLNISVTDMQGQVSEYSKKYELNSNIKLEATENGNIKIVYDGETEISYLTYRWDDEDEIKIDINSTSIDTEIETLNGRHTLTVIVVDVDNNTETKVQETNGIAVPEIEIGLSDDKTAYAITVKDDVELQEIIITLDDDENQKFGQKLNGKEFSFQIPLKQGENKLKVQVINSDDQMTERMVMFKVD